MLPGLALEELQGRQAPGGGERVVHEQNSNSVNERRQEISPVQAYLTGQQLASPWPSGAARPWSQMETRMGCKALVSALDVRRRCCVVRN